MYEQHFGCSQAPFRITPDPAFFFAGANRGAVLEALVYAVGRGEGLVKVVGEVGSGKTMLARMLERALTPACDIVYLANPRLGPDDVLLAIATELGLEVTPDTPKAAILHAVTAHLLARHAENRRVVMFVEEAQAMPLDTLEEIRMLSNLETTQEKLLQIVLFGQPELDTKLDRHEIRQLRERITHGFHLAPLDAAAIADYLAARLAAAGYAGPPLFDAAARRLLARASHGLLRRVNVLADKALLAAYAAGAARVTAAHVRRAIADVEFSHAARGARWPLRIGLAALACVAALAGLWLSPLREFLPQERAASPVAAAGPAPPATLDESVASAVARDLSPPPAPRVDPLTGLVGIDHLRPEAGPPVPPEEAQPR